ncbi:MAG: proline dehydrogenase family protein [Streptosporangiaceae bacterium]
MLRRTLLAASASQRIRELITDYPVTRSVVDRYVAGETSADAVRTAQRLRGAGLLVTLDYLGEDTKEQAQADSVTEEYVSLIGKLAAEGLTADGAVEVSVKLTAVGLYLARDGERTASENIARIAAAARDAGTTVTVDAEDHVADDAAQRIVADLRGSYPDLGIVLQAMLRRTEADCRNLAAKGSRVRLCKGAYNEPESEAYTARHDIDRSYARCLRILMEGPGYPMVASHDPRLIQIAGSLAMQNGRSADDFEYQMLFGIRPDEQRRLAASGAKVRVYVPYGDDWYGYLVRRLAEKPANLRFFLRSLGPVVGGRAS